MARDFSLGQRLVLWLSTNLVGRLLRLVFATCRVEYLNPEAVERHLQGQVPGIGVTWHRGAIFFLYFLGPYRPAIMVSRSKDGEFLARYIALNGGVPVRGSSSRGGRQALREMCDLLAKGEVLYGATVADGPRGPIYQAKAGMIMLAMHAGLPLFPLMWSADRVWVFPKAWDHTIIPKPFAKVKIMVGRELRYPRHLSHQEMEDARLELETELNRIRDEVDQLCGYKEPA